MAAKTIKDAVQALSQVVRQERRALKLTQKELGDFAGTGINFISQLEQGKISVRLDKLLSVLQVLGLELEIKRGRDVVATSPELRK